MAFFSNKTNDSFSVLQHRFDVDEIAYRYPEENFYSGSVLYVQPGQEAVLIKEGDQDGPYTNGRYTLSTNEMPRLSRFFNKAYGGKGAFNCYLYFINKDKPVSVFWGTSHEIKVRDPHTNRLIRMFARGSMALTIQNSLQFIAKMNGQLSSFTADDIDGFLYEKSIERIISHISQALQRERISFVEIESHLSDISGKIKEALNTEKFFDTYGLHLNEFSIVEININDEDFAAIQKEENDLERQRREAELEAFKIRSTGFAESDVMKEKGVYYDKQRTYDVLEAAAKNEGGIGGGGFVGAGVGLGVGLGAGAGIGNAFGNMAGNAFMAAQQQPPQQAPAQPAAQDTVICPSCKAQNPAKAKFCQECGGLLPSSNVICPSCKAENKAGAKFCQECGAALAPAKVHCPQCGTELEGTAKFCQSCGHRMN